MNKINDGGPAYPVNVLDFLPTTGEQVVRHQYDGITMRDYFAATALSMQWMGRQMDAEHEPTCDRIAHYAYKIADAMIKAREGGAE